MARRRGRETCGHCDSAWPLQQCHPSRAGDPFFVLGCNQSANGVQINPSKSKENQGKRLGFPCFSLVESSLFNRLRRIQIKKIIIDLNSRVKLWIRVSLFSPQLQQLLFDPAIERNIARILFLVKLSVRAPPDRPSFCSQLCLICQDVGRRQ